MKKYFAPEAEIYEYKLTAAILAEDGASNNYGGDEIVDEEVEDPFA